MQKVAVGIIIHQGHILICQRNKNRRYGLKWEFPGGKLEQNETFEQCLTRELLEELNIVVAVAELFAEESCNYADSGEFQVRYYLIRNYVGEIKNNNLFEQMKFVSPQKLLNYEILEGNHIVCEKLANTELEILEHSAGGIVVRQNSLNEPEFLLVLLSAHNEWGFPKGHLENGESSINAALREVEEETGVIASVVCSLPDTTYTYFSKNRYKPKRVNWFLMKYIKQGIQTHAHEISSVLWATTEVALQILSFKNDRDILHIANETIVVLGKNNLL